MSHVHRHMDNKLPVHQYNNSLSQLLKENDALIVTGETGSGKTTQIPRWCLELCHKDQRLGVACTQPRRIAAMSVASRVANEMKVTLGQEVGYSVRFESCQSQKTILKYLTDGMLLREAMLDNLLSSYAVIILDEAHERTIQTEILFGVVKRAQAARKANAKGLTPLKIIVMSATVNVKLFKRYFNCPILSIEGRQYPVQDMFTEVTQSDLITSALIAVFQIHRTCEEGDILVFCSGQDEIQTLVTLTKKAIKQAPESMQNLLALPLYASLPATNQLRVFEHKQKIDTNGFNGTNSSHTSNNHSPKFERRVIYATNVAETSVTIPNIKYIIDTGKVKCRAFCPKTGLESLKVTNISKAQAKQRSGRAGRICPGTCFRLYTKEEFSQMNEHQIPEIRRSNLDGVILQMISIGINDVSSFEFLERPDDIRIKSALKNLTTLGAIRAKSKDVAPNSNNQSCNGSSPTKRANLVSNVENLCYELTDLGKKISKFPLAPSMARIIIAANELNCLDEALTVISLLYIENIFYIPSNKQAQAETMHEKFHTNEGDVVLLLKVFKAFKRTSMLNRAGLKQWCSEHFIHVKNLRTARLVRKQLSDLCKDMGMNSSSCGQDTSILRRALTYGLVNNVATMWNGKYRNKTFNDIHIHPSSCLHKVKPECVLYVEIVETNRCYMRNCSLIDINWVREVSASSMKS